MRPMSDCRCPFHIRNQGCSPATEMCCIQPAVGKHGVTKTALMETPFRTPLRSQKSILTGQEQTAGKKRPKLNYMVPPATLADEAGRHLVQSQGRGRWQLAPRAAGPDPHSKEGQESNALKPVNQLKPKRRKERKSIN